MNRRLMLVQLDRNRQSGISHHASVIRDDLLADGGHGGSRSTVDVAGGVSSILLC